MQIESSKIPLPHKTKSFVKHITVTNQNQLKIAWSAYEGSLLSICFPDSDGVSKPMLIERDENHARLIAKSPSYGAILGRISYPYQQREMQYGRKRYMLPAMHVQKSFQKQIWSMEIDANPETSVVHATYTHADQHEDLSPALRCAVQYLLNQNNELHIIYSASAPQKFSASLANRLIWNIGNTNSVLKHTLVLYANQYGVEPLKRGVTHVSDGEHDYRQMRAIRSTCSGYYLLGSSAANRHHPLGAIPHNLSAALWLMDPKTGRYVQLFTDYPMLKIKLHSKKNYKAYGVTIQPLIPLDASELINRGHGKQRYSCVYRFGRAQ